MTIRTYASSEISRETPGYRTCSSVMVSGKLKDSYSCFCYGLSIGILTWTWIDL
jgi:hypothetical protein